VSHDIGPDAGMKAPAMHQYEMHLLIYTARACRGASPVESTRKS
jgi:hypothetical protein